jgi:hypothetical protein
VCRHDGLPVSAASVLRLLREEGLPLEANYQRERRQLAARRKAAFAVEPTGANGSVLPLVTIVTDNGGPFRSFRFGRSSPPTPSSATSAPASAHPGTTAPGSAGSAR